MDVTDVVWRRTEFLKNSFKTLRIQDDSSLNEKANHAQQRFTVSTGTVSKKKRIQMDFKFGGAGKGLNQKKKRVGCDPQISKARHMGIGTKEFILEITGREDSDVSSET